MAETLLVVGSIAFDTVRTPHGVAEDVLGGSATYFSVSASFFAPVRLVGVVGADFPPQFRKVLEGRGIDTAGLQVVADGKTFRWRGSYAGAMNEAKTEDVQLNVFGDFKPQIPARFRDSRYVFLANGSPVTQAAVLDQVAKPELVVADTMNLWIENQRAELEGLMKRIDGLVLNDGEARMLTGEHNLLAAARRVLEKGPKFVIIKKGEHGAIIADRDGYEAAGPTTKWACSLPAYPALTVFDPTGAGDSFAGGMMGFLAREGRHDFRTLVRGMAYGTVAASFAIEDFSLRRFERLTAEEIEGRLGDYYGMLAF